MVTSPRSCRKYTSKKGSNIGFTPSYVGLCPLEVNPDPDFFCVRIVRHVFTTFVKRKDACDHIRPPLENRRFHSVRTGTYPVSCTTTYQVRTSLGTSLVRARYVPVPKLVTGYTWFRCCRQPEVTPDTKRGLSAGNPRANRESEQTRDTSRRNLRNTST
jgi:hypothetical protein